MVDKKERLIKNFADPRWRLNNLYYINDKNGTSRHLKENAVQKKINDSNSRRIAILKARQFGVTTNFVLKMLDACVWNKNYVAMIMAHEDKSIKKIFQMVRRAYNSLDEQIKPRIDKGGGSQYELRFPDMDSKIYCDLSSRGDTIQWLHISEYDFISNEERIKATMGAVPVNAKLTIESTPNGVGGKFFQLWNDPNAPYEKMFFPWYFSDEYSMPGLSFPCIDQADEQDLISKALKLYNIEITEAKLQFRRFKINEIGPDDFRQEFPEDDKTCFLSSGRSAIDLMKVSEQIDVAKKPYESTETLKIYAVPDKNKKYFLGADTAEGIGQDFSVCTVLEQESREQVAQVRGQFGASEFAHEIHNLAKIFRGSYNSLPMVAVERNNHGHAVLLELDEHIKYPNLYKAADKRLGWLTDKITRPIMINAFIEGVQNKTIKLNDHDTLQECLTLVIKNGKIQAEDLKHDDCIMAASIALQLCIENKTDIYKDIKSRIRV